MRLYRGCCSIQSIREAKQFGHDSMLTGLFSLLGENYSDQCYVFEFQKIQE